MRGGHGVPDSWFPAEGYRKQFLCFPEWRILAEGQNDGVKSQQMHGTQSKAWSIKIRLTGSQSSHFHKELLNLPVGLLFIHGEMLLGKVHKYSFWQPIGLRVSNEVISTVEFRGVKMWGGKWKLSHVSVSCHVWSSQRDKMGYRILNYLHKHSNSGARVLVCGVEEWT